jgi:hypothetical protein
MNNKFLSSMSYIKILPVLLYIISFHGGNVTAAYDPMYDPAVTSLVKKENDRRTQIVAIENEICTKTTQFQKDYPSHGALVRVISGVYPHYTWAARAEVLGGLFGNIGEIAHADFFMISQTRAMVSICRRIQRQLEA